jgi:hypothetical protein
MHSAHVVQKDSVVYCCVDVPLLLHAKHGLCSVHNVRHARACAAVHLLQDTQVTGSAAVTDSTMQVLTRIL